MDTLGALSKEEYKADAVSDSVPKFKKVNVYTTFEAEYALTEGNIVIHFFHPAGVAWSKQYWLDVFPAALSEVAPEHFQATMPRLVASYTEEMKSWWLRAKNYEHILDIDSYVLNFLEALDAKLDPHLVSLT